MMLLDDLARGLLLALVSAAHCAGMCGVFALRTLALRSGGLQAWTSFVAYATGKTFTYGFLGALAGAAGGTLAILGPSVRPVLSGLVAAWLVGSAIKLVRQRIAIASAPRFLSRALARISRGIPRGPDALSRFAMGAISGALPCGVTSLALLDGAATGSPLRSTVVLLALGLGTVPALAVVAFLGRRLTERGPKRAWRWVGAVALLLLAAWNLRITWTWILSTPATGTSACCH